MPSLQLAVVKKNDDGIYAIITTLLYTDNSADLGQDIWFGSGDETELYQWTKSAFA